ncbi:MAG: radical SAM protein [Nitrososphaeraceae archaeon]
MNHWYTKSAPELQTKKSKSLLHPFIVKKYRGLTINPYQGCHHRCGYCYATYQWSPEFYDKIYSKSNAPEILKTQLESWKSENIAPVMISSATDPYQPAELKFELTRKCIRVLQDYNFPYYVFTKSSIISRDLELHKQYKDNCFIIWSITTSNEAIRRVVEPGTPPAHSLFSVIEKFRDDGIRCGVNIAPIMPLITDSPDNLESILDDCLRTGVGHVVGAILRLRSDIWERTKSVLIALSLANGIKEYEKIYHFRDPMGPGYNIESDHTYSKRILENLSERVRAKGMSFDFPDLIDPNRIKKYRESFNNKDQLTLMNYM